MTGGYACAGIRSLVPQGGEQLVVTEQLGDAPGGPDAEGLVGMGESVTLNGARVTLTVRVPSRAIAQVRRHV
jgi:hypothetical protein